MESFYERWLKRNKVENERGLQLLQTQTSLNQSEVKTIVWEKFSYILKYDCIYVPENSI